MSHKDLGAGGGIKLGGGDKISILPFIQDVGSLFKD